MHKLQIIFKNIFDIILALTLTIVLLYNPLVRPKQSENYGYWSISKKENRLLGGITGHTFLELKDNMGEVVFEMHGLATNASGTEWKQVGNTNDDYLKVWEFDGSKYERYTDKPVTKTGVEIVTGTESEIMSIWNTLRSCSTAINQKNIHYPRYGINILGETQNSNSASYTLILCAGLEDKELGLFTVGGKTNLLEDAIPNN